ncbi:MAG: ParB/RepB/Spo0J family partition protein [Gammaproteobacteria bacterium]
MILKKRGLGRGLEALLSGVRTNEEKGAAQGALRNLPLDVIQRGKYQPRTNMHAESLEDLANSIRAQGVVQPIVVRALSTPGSYEIIAGERRWRAAQLAGLTEIPAVIRNVPDQAAIAMALIENIQREDLNPLEEANALQRLINEFELTHQRVAEEVGRSRAAVSNLLRLLTLNDDVKRLLEEGKLEMGHARALLGLEGGPQSEAAHSVVAKGLSVRETEHLVQQLQHQPKPGKASAKTADPNIRKLEQDLSEKLGASVVFQQGNKGKGKLVISYNNLDELEGILAHIK